MCGVVVRGLIVHDVPAGHEPNRDEDASDGKEFGVAMHWTSDHRDPRVCHRAILQVEGVSSNVEPKAG